MRTMAVVLLASLLATSALADQKGLETMVQMRAVTDQIMTKVGTGDLEGGLGLMQPLTVIPTSEFEAAVGQVKLQAPMYAQRFGPQTGSEFIKEDKVGDSLVRLTYIAKFEHHAMRWQFYCYHARAGWVIDTFRFDDQIQALFP
jgi:hypothetical protein